MLISGQTKRQGGQTGQKRQRGSQDRREQVKTGGNRRGQVGTDKDRRGQIRKDEDRHYRRGRSIFVYTYFECHTRFIRVNRLLIVAYRFRPFYI
jgi:hypothetical protein